MPRPKKKQQVREGRVRVSVELGRAELAAVDYAAALLNPRTRMRAPAIRLLVVRGYDVVRREHDNGKI